MALYRRYRPQTFQDVIGQEHVTRPLMAALRADRTAHAYLFSGPRGCGKTTSARILARCLNCAQAPTDTPCGQCESCRELALGGGGSLDVVEMDAASHGGVDDARELIERAAFAPSRDRYKVFIIDEAHMVSTQGFNALLKLVEEPPAHIKFVFATTEPEKVIGTIRSRTHHYPFRLVPPDELERYMAQICVEENIAVGSGVLPLVVRAGGGSVRDSLSVLDQLMGGSENGGLDYAQAIALLGYTDGSLLDDAVEAIAAGDGATLFAVVERVIQSGHDPRRFVEDLLQRLRDVIVISLAGEHAHDVLASVPQDQFERMCNQAEHLGASRASRAADLANEALNLMVGATSPRLQMELLCARLLAPSNATGMQIEGHGGGMSEGASGGMPGGASGWEENNAMRRGSSGGAASSRPAVPPQRPAVAQRPASPVKSGGNPTTPGRKISPAWAAQAHTSSVAPPPGMPDASVPQGRVGQEKQDVASGSSHQVAASAPVSSETHTTPSVAVPSSAEYANPSVPGAVNNETKAGVNAGVHTPVSTLSAGNAQVETNEYQQFSSPSLPASRSDAGQPGASTQLNAGGGDGDVSLIRQRWKEVTDSIRMHSKSTAALVDERDAVIAGVREGVLGIQFRTAALATTFNERGHAPRVVAALNDVLGLKLQVRGFVGGESGPKVRAAGEVASAVQYHSSSDAVTQTGVHPTGQQKNEGGQAQQEVRQEPVAHPQEGKQVRRKEAEPQRQEKSSSLESLAVPQPHSFSSSGRSQASSYVTEKSPDSPRRQEMPSAAPRNPIEMPKASREATIQTPDMRDLEARGLVLASDDVTLPSGPPPTRDQLAAQLRALEASHAQQAAENRPTSGQPDESADVDVSHTAPVRPQTTPVPESLSESKQARVAMRHTAQSAPNAAAEAEVPTSQRNVEENNVADPHDSPGVIDPQDPAGVLGQLIDRHEEKRDERSALAEFYLPDEPPLEDEYAMVPDTVYPIPSHPISDQWSDSADTGASLHADGQPITQGAVKENPGSSHNKDNLSGSHNAATARIDSASSLASSSATESSSSPLTPSNLRIGSSSPTGTSGVANDSERLVGQRNSPVFPHQNNAVPVAPPEAGPAYDGGPVAPGATRNVAEKENNSRSSEANQQPVDLPRASTPQQTHTNVWHETDEASNPAVNADPTEARSGVPGVRQGPVPPLKDSQEPFYAQQMPMPPRPGASPTPQIIAPSTRASSSDTSSTATTEASRSMNSADSGAQTAGGASSHGQFVLPENPTVAPASGRAEFSIPQRPASLGESRGLGRNTGNATQGRSSIQSISERILAAHGNGATPRARISEEDIAKQRADEDEVSASDPTVSQSDLVGIDVVIDTFKGAVIEEKPRENGSE